MYNDPKPYKQKKTKQEALKKYNGPMPMGSTDDQRKEARKRVLGDMRKRGMMRKKKGQ